MLVQKSSKDSNILDLLQRFEHLAGAMLLVDTSRFWVTSRTLASRSTNVVCQRECLANIHYGSRVSSSNHVACEGDMDDTASDAPASGLLQKIPNLHQGQKKILNSHRRDLRKDLSQS
mmetsp:Transcript_25016/g.55877  ORF Transcript_25016/g.55877 Transcript_25016/m.55877 type:complete len:118 (+) Transcript_25016:797-1150(+)